MRFSTIIAVAMAFSGVLFPLKVSAQDVEFQVSCKALAKHQAAGADYKPGVDVHGKPVASADLSSHMNNLNYPIVIPVKLDVLQFLDIDTTSALSAAGLAEAEVAYFTLYEDGRMEYNGQDFSDRVSYVCSEDAVQQKDAEGAVVPTPAAAVELPAPTVPLETAVKPRPADVETE